MPLSALDSPPGEELVTKKDDEQLTIGPAAKRAGVSPSWLRLECERGRIPFTLAGKLRLFRAADLDAYRRERERAKRSG